MQSPPRRGPPLRTEAGQGDIDSSPRQVDVNVALIANAVLPTDDVMNAVE
jgi:hypothetical protein